jgi:hypothetical protein
VTHIWRSLIAPDMGYHKPQTAKPKATPLPKQSVFQPTFFLFPSTIYAFQTRLFAVQNLLQKKSK